MAQFIVIYDSCVLYPAPLRDLLMRLGICEAIRNRKSCRAYLDQDVSLDIIEQISEAARWAPSGVNHQPTQIAVLGKETKSKLAKILVEKHSTSTPPNPDYAYCPKDWSDCIHFTAGKI